MGEAYSELRTNGSGRPTASTTRTATPAAGEGGVPLVLLQHFRGNLDNWDPALIDALARAGGS